MPKQKPQSSFAEVPMTNSTTVLDIPEIQQETHYQTVHDEHENIPATEVFSFIHPLSHADSKVL